MSNDVYVRDDVRGILTFYPLLRHKQKMCIQESMIVERDAKGWGEIGQGEDLDAIQSTI